MALFWSILCLSATFIHAIKVPSTILFESRTLLSINTLGTIHTMPKLVLLQNLRCSNNMAQQLLRARTTLIPLPRAISASAFGSAFCVSITSK